MDRIEALFGFVFTFIVTYVIFLIIVAEPDILKWHWIVRIIYIIVSLGVANKALRE